MSLVSYSCSTDSEDELNNNSESKRKLSKQTKKKRKVIIRAFNLHNNCETSNEKNIKSQNAGNQSTLLDILPKPKCSQSNNFGDQTRKQSNLLKFSDTTNKIENSQNNPKEENNNFPFLKFTEIANNGKSAKSELNVSSSTSYNGTAENITSIKLSENQYKHLKKDAAPNIRNINVTDMLEDQKLRICKKITKDISTVTQENVQEPTMPSIKKNHITYLAYKAKINEQDLKNQWSLNKMTRQQTRAKYGF